MIICLIFLVLILVVNLPDIVQKSLTDKLVNGDYKTENGQLKMIEWFKLYPLKKLLLALLWLFCAYVSIKGLKVFWIEKYQGLIWIELFFLGFTLLSAYKIWKYIKTPYHCAIVLKKFYSKEELEHALRGEKFECIQFKNSTLQKAVRIFNSKNWLIINGILYDKKYMTDFKYMFMGNTNNIWITYYNGKGLILPFSSIDLSGDRGEEVKQVLQRIVEQEEFQ